MTTPSNPTPLTMIQEALVTFHRPGDVFELRIPKSRQKTVSGYFNDAETGAKAALEWDGRCEGIYMTVNPIDPALLARAANRLVPYAHLTTADQDVRARRWFLIDFDPCRPSGISSTKAQHVAALQRAKACRDLLRERGWPDPVVGDSGNGAHLSYRVDLPNEPHIRDLFKRALAALDLLLSDDAVSVDQTPHNAARVWKLYGTLACKGDSTPVHPRRRSRLLKLPQGLMAVDLEQLENLAQEGDGVLRHQAQSRLIARDTPRFNPDGWIARYALPVDACVSWQSGRKWIFRVCPWNPDHTNRSAYLVQLPSGGIAAGCHHAGCASNDWENLRDLYEPEWRERRARWELADGTTATSTDENMTAGLADALRDLTRLHDAVSASLRRVSDLVNRGAEG